MKKSIFIVAALFAGMVAIAQQKKAKQLPPPPPPKVNLDKFAPPPPPKEPPPPKVVMEKFNSPNDDNYQAFLKRNPTVKGLGWQQENRVRVRLKSGKEEVYNLNKKDEAAKLKNKYGELPAPPPPPPPPKVRKISQS